ncbi:catalase [Rhizobium rhizosphaerae]|uniref:Catalase n=2 Tax=Xaviernesmea rhizosphaerae TaxID=1672749 RepID=A0ABX3PBJ2_9HYPH|nr:catalase [Xaviernesmea rhizosphaerae]
MTMTPSLSDRLQRYRDDLEVIEKDEPETARALAETMMSIAYKTYEDGGHAIRTVHAKSHGLLEAEVEVYSDLPAPLAQGLFAQPARYRAIVRLSTTPGDILHDSVSTPRGFALKILDVEGERLNPEEDSRSQDFVMANGKQFNAPSAKAFLKNLKLLAATTDRAEGLKQTFSKVLRGVEGLVEKLGGESAALKAMGGQPETHILGESFFSQLPMRYGDYVAKLAIVPVSPELTALTGTHLELDDDKDALRHAVEEFFRMNGGTWELRVQLCTDAERMPIEDASAAWSEEESPFIPVARIHAEPQTAWSEEKALSIDDGMSFRPFNGLSAHRPLGSMMRMRKLAYRRSAGFRSERNEPGIDELSKTGEALHPDVARRVTTPSQAPIAAGGVAR